MMKVNMVKKKGISVLILFGRVDLMLQWLNLDEDEEAWKWLARIPKETWARHAMDMDCNTDLFVNNMSEVFNRCILEVRSKPIKTMTDGIRSKLMVRYQGNRNKIEETRWEITPTYA